MAKEGVNANLYGHISQLNPILNLFRSDMRFSNLQVNRTPLDKSPYRRMKIKCKPEIITFRHKTLCASLNEHLSPHQWNNLIRQKDTVIVDARNDFENAMGSFRNAINPRLRSFSCFPHYADKQLDYWQNKRIALFCTGGIRCEKAASFLKSKGLTSIYQLSGGIIRYLQDIPAAESCWEGDCFVFDERISIK